MTATPHPSKYPRTPYATWSPSLPTDALVADMTRFVNTPIVITEKLDGSNVLIHNGTAHPRSVSGASRHGWLGMVRKFHAWRSLEFPGHQIYGEDIYGVHSIEYDPVPENRTYYVFAILRRHTWLAWEDVARIASEILIPTAPVLYQGTPQRPEELRDITAQLMKEPSALGPEREGIVIRRAHAFQDNAFQNSVCKMVRPGHVQPDDRHWSTHWTPCRLLPAAPEPTAHER